MRIDGFMTVDAVESELASRIRGQRLAANITQEDLAGRTGLSVRTIANLERGQGVRLDGFIRVLQALGLQGNLDMVVPQVEHRPAEYLRETPQRKRASGRRLDLETTWTWGDEQ